MYSTLYQDNNHQLIVEILTENPLGWLHYQHATETPDILRPKGTEPLAWAYYVADTIHFIMAYLNFVSDVTISNQMQKRPENGSFINRSRDSVEKLAPRSGPA